MNDPFNTPAAPSFDDPLEMLQACHGRITAQCDTLQRLVAHLQMQGNDEQAGQAARAILRYFDTAGQYHHQDEEQDLFPALLASGDSEAAAYVAKLLEEHKVMDAAWQALRPLLVAIAEDSANTLDADVVAHFIDSYARHIAFENSQLLPLATTLLDTQQLQLLGRCMAERRGVAD
ncbi:MAG: hemerythrin domain-containing protein [Gammaproteobacteria bacterium]|nr:hemerythrin domain-containing protein [Sideroxydans sp.]MBU3902865.1 hemerythrin domain-containing protein [Gammaproteobacteria bacterium]MBU4045170.1 hemerythrin domain-containing protein [Gammaproteobacteria bacterium]